MIPSEEISRQIPLLRSPADEDWWFRLRDYQRVAIDLTIAALAENRLARGTIVLPTGTGKTRLAAGLIRRWLAANPESRVCFLAERGVILEQARSALEAFAGGERVGLEKAGSRTSGERIFVASRQTLARAHRLSRFTDGRPPDLVIVDECHHATSLEYAKILAAFPGAAAVGLTATPDRTDREDIRQIFPENFYHAEISSMVADGWLVPLKTLQAESGIDLRSVRRVGGEYEDAEVSRLLTERTALIAAEIAKHCAALRTIVFTTRVEIAHDLAVAINLALGRECAVSVDGAMDDAVKHDLLSGFRTGKHQFLCNVNIATEGYDAPDTDAVVIARPVMSRALFAQMAGRVLRPGGFARGDRIDNYRTAAERCAAIAASAKPSGLLLSFRYVTKSHTLASPDDLFGSKCSLEARIAAAKLRDENPELTVTESLERAEASIEALANAERIRAAELEREKNALRNARVVANSDWRKFDPFARLDPSQPTDEQCSARMRAYLTEKLGPIPANLSQKNAVKIRREIAWRESRGFSASIQPAVSGQIAWLAARGIDASQFSYAQASREMSRLQRPI